MLFCSVLLQWKRLIFCARASKVLNVSQRNWATIERELFAISWGCEKLRCFVYGLHFEVYTDHKPLVGLFKKTGEVPNNRMQIMLLSIAEYDITVNYLPGIRNIIADYGTRQIDISEWDKPSYDDPEGIHELLAFETNQVSDSHFFHKSNISERDLQIIQKLKLDSYQTNQCLMVTFRSANYIWLPQHSKRAFFWKIHSHLHSGATKILQQLRKQNIYWSNAANEIEILLSQCICAVKKDTVPKPYSERRPITAAHPLHILSIDLYTFDGIDYFTAICIFSKFAWVRKIKNGQASTVCAIYEQFCSEFQEPIYVSCDNGPEFNLIPTQKVSNPSYHPQANSIVERFHLELGKQSRIHNITPDKAVHVLNSSDSKLQMSVYLNNEFHHVNMCVMEYTTRVFRYNDLVWRHVNRRARGKQEDTYTGPHRILKRMGTLSYQITSHLKNSRKCQVNLNDIKKFHVPDTTIWKMERNHLEQAAAVMDVRIKNDVVLINFGAIEAVIQDILDHKIPHVQFVVIPDWPCMSWYERLHQEITAEAVKLPNDENTFVDLKERPLGLFPWDNWLFAIQTET